MDSSGSIELPPGVPVTKGKVVVIGEFSVGKTMLTNRFVLQHVPQKAEPTIGAAFQLRTVLMPGGTQAVKFEIWDTAGSERYRSLMPMYYRDASAAIVCYDICNARSFDRVTSWIDDFRKSAEQSDTNPNPLVVLVGTKSDLAALPGKREISLDVAQQFAKQEGLTHFETSAKQNENITEVFMSVAHHIVKEAKSQEAAEKERMAQQGVSSSSRSSGRGQQKVDLREDNSVGGFRGRRSQLSNDNDGRQCSC